MCRKSTTWDPQLYFLSEGSHTQDFYALKNPSTPAGIKPTNLGSRGEYDNHWTTGVDFYQSERTIARDVVRYKRWIYPCYRIVNMEHQQRWTYWWWTMLSKHLAKGDKGATILKVYKCCTPVNKAMSEISNCSITFYPTLVSSLSVSWECSDKLHFYA